MAQVTFGSPKIPNGEGGFSRTRFRYNGGGVCAELLISAKKAAAGHARELIAA